MQIEKATLDGGRVRLEPLAPNHAPGLIEAIRDGELWKLPVTLVPHPGEVPAFIAAADAAFQERRELAFATVDRASGRIAGSTRFRCIERAHRRVEIGFSFLGHSWQRTHVNTEAKYLMLRHAFEHWGCNRVELLTDALNAPSRAAILRLGAREEGVLRQHMVMRDGRLRDSVIYSLISSEWAEARAALEDRLRR